MSLKDINKLLEAAQSDLVFVPTPDMRRVKAAFWNKLSNNFNLIDMSQMTLAAVQQIEKDRRLIKWWSLPGFSDWFQNKEEFKERLEYLADLALDALEQVLNDPNASPGARVSCAKLVLEATSKMPTKVEEMAPSRLEKMSRGELEEYVRHNLKYLSPNEVLTNSPSPDTVIKDDT